MRNISLSSVRRNRGSDQGRGSPGRPQRRLGLLAVFALVAALLSAAPAASAQELLSGVADESGTAGPRWTRTFFTPDTTRDHTLTLAWTGGGNLSMAVRVAATNQWVDDATTSNNPEVLTTELTAGVEYKIAVWAVSGVGTYTLTVDGDEEPPSSGLTIQRNHLDAAAGPAEIRAEFTPTTSGPVTVELSWNGSADLDLIVERDDNGTVIGESTGSDNPERVVADVVPGVEYRIRSIAVSGATDFAVSLAGDRIRAAPPSGAPNILIINVDDARTDALVVMDAVMQWFGDEGTFFPNGYITTPACCPSRAALMSGQYNHNNGQIEQNVKHLNDADTLQHYLYDAGYLTGHTGKFLHYYDTSERGPYWDRWNYFKGGYFDVWMNRDGYGYRPVGYSTVITFDRAIEFAEDFDSFEDDRPWLLHVTPIAPHRPSLPEPKYEDAPVPEWSPDPSVGEADRSDKPPFVRNFNYSPAAGEAERAEMLRTLMSVDEQVDRLMTRLEALGELDNTLAIFTSDNGVLWGEHGLPEKFVPYQRAIDVPFLIRWPGQVAAGAVDDRPVANIDIAPTVLAAAGVSSEHPMDGSNILSGFVRPWRFTEYFLDEANGTGLPSWSSIRSDTIEYTEYYDEAGAITFREYYDLVADPYELVNLLADGDPGNDPDVSGLHDLVTQYSLCGAETCQSVLRFVDDAVSAGIYEVNESWEAVPVDYDLDGDLDLWIGLHDQGARLWSNEGDGTFTRVAPTAWPKVNRYGRIPDRHTCTFADVDGDGDVDAYCAAGRGGDNPVKYDRENELWLQTSPGVFAEVGREWGVGELCGRSHYVAFLRANGDSYPDLYVGNTPPRDDPTDPCNDPANQLPSEESKLFINTGGTALVPTTTMGIGGFGGGRCAEVVDFNGDGWDDLLVCGNPATYLFANQGGTGFIDVAPAQQLSGTVSDAVMGDLDGDGDTDLVTINWRNVSYRLNDNGVFGAAVSIAVLNPPGGRSVDVGDADGDGDLDVYTLRANGIQGTNPDDILFLNDNLSFTPVPVPAASGVGDAVTAIDIDSDGATEFVVLNGLTFGPIQLLRLTTE